MGNESFKNEPVFLMSQEKQTSNKSLTFPFFILFVIIIFGAGFFYIEHQISTPFSQKTEERQFIVRTGESLNIIAKNLEEVGLIKNHLYFVLYAWKGGFSNRLQAGDYLLSSAMSISQIAQKIKNGDIVPREVTITIPEGFKINQVEERLKKAGFPFLISKLQIKEFKNGYEFLKGVPEGLSLEGFLFPDTYEFYPEASAEEIVKKMLDNFDKKLTSDLRGEISRQGKKIDDIITMASLIEKEVKTFEDRQIVSGIFWKRLKEQRPLESCATIAYILNTDKWRYSIEDTRRPSPYNTYINLGLPPGPICNPGIESIKAAISPTGSSYDFFLTDPETQNTIFSKNLEEHNLNKAKYFK